MSSLLPIIQVILQVLQIVSAILLIILVMIHSPKSDSLGGMGSMANLFTSQRSAEAGLNKLTTWVASLFFASSLILGYFFNYPQQ